MTNYVFLFLYLAILHADGFPQSMPSQQVGELSQQSPIPAATITTDRNRRTTPNIKSRPNPSVKNTVRSLASDAVIFPSSDRKPTSSAPGSTRGRIPAQNKTYVPDKKLMESCSKSIPGNTLCLDVEGYPSDLVDSIFKKKKFKSDLLGNDTIRNELSTRFDVGENSMCRSQVQLMFPKSAQNKEGAWKFILQGSDDSSKQGVSVELCSRDDNSLNESCMFSDRIKALGYEADCHQKYIYRKMEAIRSSDGEAYQDEFVLPSCCMCMYKTIDLAARFKSSTTSLAVTQP